MYVDNRIYTDLASPKHVHNSIWSLFKNHMFLIEIYFVKYIFGLIIKIS